MFGDTWPSQKALYHVLVQCQSIKACTSCCTTLAAPATDSNAPVHLVTNPPHVYMCCRAVPDFGFGRNPAVFPNPAEIRLRQKSHRSRIVLPDLKSQFLEYSMLDYLDISCLRSTYCLHCCGINYCVSACKWCNGNCCTKNNQKLKSLVRS